MTFFCQLLRHRAGSAPLLAVVLSFCLSLGALDGRVLCMGANGHVAIEHSIAGRCGGFLAAGDADHLSHSSLAEDHEGHCGPCIDIAMNTGHFGKPERSQQTVVAPVQGLSPLAAPSHVFYSLIPSRRVWHLLPPPRDGALNSLHTTVLLI